MPFAASVLKQFSFLFVTLLYAAWVPFAASVSQLLTHLFFFEAAVCGVGAVRGVGFETVVCFLSTLFSALVPFAVRLAGCVFCGFCVRADANAVSLLNESSWSSI